MKLGPQRSYHHNYPPQVNAGHDDSIPEDSDHAKHLRLIFAASRRGFVWLERRRGA